MTPPVASEAISQPIFLADQIPVDSDAPRPPRLNLRPPMRGVSAIPEHSISLNDPEDPFGFHDGPRHNLPSQRLAENYGANIMIPPEVQLPANWDAPLRNPMPVVPPMPAPHRRRRGRAPHGPLHDISGRQSDPALNGLHRGHIAHREHAANHRADFQNLLRQRQQHQEQQIQIERERLRQQAQFEEQIQTERERFADLQLQAEQQAQLQQQQRNDQQLRREAQVALLRAQERERREAQLEEQLRAEQGQLTGLRMQSPRPHPQNEDHQLWREARAAALQIQERREAQQVVNDEEERQILEEHQREVTRMRQHECAFSSGSGSGNNNQRTLEEEERQNFESYQRQENNVHQQGAHASRPSRRANNQLHSEADAAADYERNRNYENQARRREEAQQHREQAVNPRRTNNAANNIPPQTIPKGRRPYHEPQGGPERHSLGPMNVECNHCHALHFDSEKLSASTLANKKFGSCCLQGQVQLPAFRELPRTLRDMLHGISPHSNSFKKNIRQYNAAFAFASLGVKVDHAITNAPGPYCFRINGDLHHLSGSLLPENGVNESYAQIYIHDPAVQLDMRQ
jgi:hypothetical protein